MSNRATKSAIVDAAESAQAVKESLAKDSPTPLIITRNGKPLAILLPTLGADMESVRLNFDPKFLALIQESRLAVAREGAVPLSEVEAMFADDLASEDDKSS